MEISLNVLNHLGINLYSNVPAVLSEVVANSWDADSTNVLVNIDIKESVIVIEDDGCGMDVSDINRKFLSVGYKKREDEDVVKNEVGDVVTPIYGRPVMGRKGIGKLSLFSIAEVIEVYSCKDGVVNGLSMNSEHIREQINEKPTEPYYPEELDTKSIDLEKGTRIVLRSLKKRLNRTGQALRKRLARRFSIIGSSNDFYVEIDDSAIVIADRDYFHKVEYLWYFGEESSHYIEACSNLKHAEFRDNLLNGGHRISGWLGLVEHSNSLQEDEDNLNKIVLLMRGKMAKEDILEEFREGGLYAKFLFGEISADFLDGDINPDIATSSRQAIFEEDDRFISLKDFIWEELKNIQRKRAEYKREEAITDATAFEPINEWYTSLGSDTKKRAKKLFAKINQVAVDEKHKRQLFSHGVLAFESLRYKESLDSLEKISVENIDMFLEVFKEFDEIEATLYYKITKERLEIISKLKEKVHEEDALEKILQQYLFKYLWLLDPSWDRATENAYMEERAQTQFDLINAKLTKEEAEGRLDIVYKKPSGKHVIIELKRASVKTDVNKLLGQVKKYGIALKKLLKLNNSEDHPLIETICIVGRELKDWEDPTIKENDVKQMESQNVRVVFYQELINEAYNSYKEYIDQNKEKGKLLDLIKRIEDDID